jgi:hypothetical protein
MPDAQLTTTVLPRLEAGVIKPEQVQLAGGCFETPSSPRWRDPSYGWWHQGTMNPLTTSCHRWTNPTSSWRQQPG